MVFDHIIIDCFNLAYRCFDESKPKNEIARKMIYFIEVECKKHKTDSTVFHFLYDPIPKENAPLERAYRHNPNSRRYIDDKYKATRKLHWKVIPILRLFMRYYEFRGENYKSYVSYEYEADDYVESLLKTTTGNVALITTDEDWCRYITDKIVMFPGSLDKPFSIASYVEKYGFNPTVASVTLYKAIFGDKSDNIIGIFSNKKIRLISNVQNVTKMMLVYIANEKLTLKEVVKALKYRNIKDLYSSGQKSALEDFIYELHIIESTRDDPFNIILDNIALIESKCKNANDYVHYKEENPRYNKLMEEMLFKQDDKKKPDSRFGVKI